MYDGRTVLNTEIISILREQRAESESARLKKSLACSIDSSELLGSDLGHLECPEADAALLQRINDATDHLFSVLPAPENPMAAALSKTADEEAAGEVNEVLVEMVREQYRARVESQRLEQERIDRAEVKRMSGGDPNALTVEEQLKQRKQDDLKRRIARLKAQLAAAEDELCMEDTETC